MQYFFEENTCYVLLPNRLCRNCVAVIFWIFQISARIESWLRGVSKQNSVSAPVRDHSIYMCSPQPELRDPWVCMPDLQARASTSCNFMQTWGLFWQNSKVHASLSLNGIISLRRIKYNASHHGFVFFIHFFLGLLTGVLLFCSKISCFSVSQ